MEGTFIRAIHDRYVLGRIVYSSERRVGFFYGLVDWGYDDEGFGRGSGFSKVKCFYSDDFWFHFFI